jgi:hypothetical protein
MLGYLMHSRGLAVGEDTSSLIITNDSLREIINGFNSDPMKPSPALVAPRIYGDDIIVDSDVTSYVTDLLERLGLVVNHRKSFTGSQLVRESCGIYAYCGDDVTPVLFRVRNHSNVIDAQVFASLISQINIVGDNKWRNLHKRLINYLLNEVRIGGVREHNHRRMMPFVTDRDQFGIYTKRVHVTPDHQIRENVAWQRTEIRRLGLRAVGGRDPAEDFDLYRYDQGMRALAVGEFNDETKSYPTVRPSLTRVSAGWTPLAYVS